MADGIQLPIGFHDDSFAHSTLPTIDWHFMSKINQTKTNQRWKTAPIGGELRPEVQSFIWKRPLPTNQKFEDFAKCVKPTHCSWLINQHVFNCELAPDRFRRALATAQSLGYELHVSQATLDKKQVSERLSHPVVSVTIENRGIAPLYNDWPVEFQLKNSKPTYGTKTDWKLSEIQPGESKVFPYVFNSTVLRRDKYSVSIRIPNVLKHGKPIGFANARTDKLGLLLLARFDNR